MTDEFRELLITLRDRWKNTPVAADIDIIEPQQYQHIRPYRHQCATRGQGPGSAYCRICATCDCRLSLPLAVGQFEERREHQDPRTPNGARSPCSRTLSNTIQPQSHSQTRPYRHLWMTRTVASDHGCCRRSAVRAHARCPAPRRVPSRHFQVSRSLMSNPGEEVGTNPSHASSTCGSMLRSSR